MQVTLSTADVLYFAGAITAVAVAVNWIAKAIEYLLRPKNKQNVLIKNHQDKLDKHDVMLDHDKKRLDSLEEQDRLVIKALLALLEHSIDGNNINQMKEVKNDLNKYLISK